MATVKANSYPLAAALMVALLVWAWGTGEDGDFGFAMLCAGVAVVAFAIGAWTRSWWLVPLSCAVWFCGWMVGGELAPDTYVAAIAFAAPGPAILVALGVAAGRRRARLLA
jgi:hypothetical protein